MEQDGIQKSADECRICLETAKDAVLTKCGHLYCWPCLHRWFSMQPHPKICPLCSALVDEDILPSIRDGKNTEDPRNEVQPDAK